MLSEDKLADLVDVLLEVFSFSNSVRLVLREYMVESFKLFAASQESQRRLDVSTVKLSPYHVDHSHQI